MKSKIAIGLVILAVIMVGGWYISKMPPSSQQTISADQQSEALTLPGTTTSTSSPNPSGTAAPATNKKDLVLQARAMQIIATPLVINIPLTDTQKQDIVKQLNAIKNKITENYELEAPWLDLGNIRKYLKDYDGAIAAWNFLAIVQPKGHLAYHQLGSLYGFELHNYQKSEENFLKAIQITPSDIDAYAQLITVYEAYKPEQIEPFLLSATTRYPSDASLKILLGQYYAKIGEKANALKYLEEALKLNPANTALKTEIEELKK